MRLSSSQATTTTTSPGTRRKTLRAPSRSRVPYYLSLLYRSFELASPLFYLTALVMVASLVLGGGTRSGFISDALLQLTAIPLLLFALWKLVDVPITRQMRLALFFCLAVAGLPLLQLIPLPPWLWTALPARGPSAAAFEILGETKPWMPISVAPEATWLSALSLIPPLAIFIATLLLSYRERRWLSLVVLAVGVVSVFVGLIQVAQGPESPLRFFAITNPTEAVGFFANRNHFAALAYTLMLFAVAWAVHAATALAVRLQRRQYEAMPILAAIGGFTVLVLFLAGEAMARSRAGLGLTMAALFGALALGLPNQRFSPTFTVRGLFSRFTLERLLSGLTPTKLLIAAIALSATFSLQYALFRIQERFEADPVSDARAVFIPNTIEAAKAYMPFGSGLGTFVSVYPLFEKPEDTLANTYANHAHSDALEAWLEAGLLGLVLMGVFVSWLVFRSLAVWRSSPPLGASELDWSLARAAPIIVALVLAHSLLDYPLRTGAIMAIVAFACALLIEPPAGTEPREDFQAAPPRARHRQSHRAKPVPASAFGPPPSRPHEPGQPADLPPRSQGSRWGKDINWPKEWSNASKPESPDDTNERPNPSDPVKR